MALRCGVAKFVHISSGLASPKILNEIERLHTGGGCCRNTSDSRLIGMNFDEVVDLV